MNVPLLQKRLREISGGYAGGHTITVADFPRYDLDVVLKLTLEKIPINPQTILIAKMTAVIENMSEYEPLKPFLEAVKIQFEWAVEASKQKL